MKYILIQKDIRLIMVTFYRNLNHMGIVNFIGKTASIDMRYICDDFVGQHLR